MNFINDNILNNRKALNAKQIVSLIVAAFLL